MECLSCHPSGALSFKVAFTFLEYLFTLGIYGSNYLN